MLNRSLLGILTLLISACGQGTATAVLEPSPTDRALKLCNETVFLRNQDAGVLIPFGSYWLINGSVEQTGMRYNLFKDAQLESKLDAPKCRITIAGGRITGATEDNQNVNLNPI